MMFENAQQRNEWQTAILFQQSLLSQPRETDENKISNFKKLIENHVIENKQLPDPKQVGMILDKKDQDKQKLTLKKERTAPAK